MISRRGVVVVREISSEWVDTFRPVVSQEQAAWIRMPFWMHSNSIPEFALSPICARDDWGDRINPQVTFGNGGFEQNVEMIAVKRKKM
jgi:hypothetical protein